MQSLNGADAGRGQVDRVLKDVEFPVTKRATWTREQSLAGHEWSDARLAKVFPEACTWTSGEVCLDFGKNGIVMSVLKLLIEIQHTC